MALGIQRLKTAIAPTSGVRVRTLAPIQSGTYR
jgi:hypothetical protein